MESSFESKGYNRGDSNRSGNRTYRSRTTGQDNRPSGDGGYRKREYAPRYGSDNERSSYRTGYGKNNGEHGRDADSRRRGVSGYQRKEGGGYQRRDGGYQNRENVHQPRTGYNNSVQKEKDGGFQFGRTRYERNEENGTHSRQFGQNRAYRPNQQGLRNNDFRNKALNGGENRDGYDRNAKYSQKKRIEYKKQFVDYTQPMRLNKFLANSGICSRREADDYIGAGVVSVNGVVVTELGSKIVPATDKVMFHDQPVKVEKKVYILLNKPKDCVTTVEDTHDRMTVLDLVKNACSERVYPVGRLDRNTTGVLLITNDGDLTSKLTHPKYDKKKIYQVTLDKDLTDEDYEKIVAGFNLEDGFIKVDELAFVNDEDRRTVGVEIHSGRNRIVRRIFDHFGYHVIKLDRVYFAGLTKKNLPRGRWRYLSEMEVNMLKMTAAAMKD